MSEPAARARRRAIQGSRQGLLLRRGRARPRRRQLRRRRDVARAGDRTRRRRAGPGAGERDQGDAEADPPRRHAGRPGAAAAAEGHARRSSCARRSTASPKTAPTCRSSPGEYNLDGSQITFYFTSTKDRVDFRPLVRDLSDALRHEGADAAGGRARPREDARRLRRLRPAALLRVVADVVPVRLDQDGEGAGPAAEPAEDLRRLRPALLLPDVRVRGLPRAARPDAEGRARWSRRPSARRR